MNRDLDAYWHDGFHHVPGWLAPELLPYLRGIMAAQREAGTNANVAEIGVYRGKLLLALAHMTSAERAVAIDIFDDQTKNIDGSGDGAMAPIRENWDRYAPVGCDLIAVKADTLALTIGQRVEISQQHGPFSLFSVDGGHTAEHVVNDLLIAQDMLADGGVILADDIFHRHWPGVTEGLYSFYFRYHPRVVPFLSAHNKLFMVSATMHAHFLRHTIHATRDVPHVKRVRMFGWDVVAVG